MAEDRDRYRDERTVSFVKVYVVQVENERIIYPHNDSGQLCTYEEVQTAAWVDNSNSPLSVCPCVVARIASLNSKTCGCV